MGALPLACPLSSTSAPSIAAVAILRLVGSGRGTTEHAQARGRAESQLAVSSCRAMSPSEQKQVFCAAIGGSLAQYPHAKRVGNLLFLSGLSARQKDNSVVGVEVLPDGTVVRSIAEQTEGVIQK